MLTKNQDIFLDIFLNLPPVEMRHVLKRASNWLAKFTLCECNRWLIIFCIKNMHSPCLPLEAVYSDNRVDNKQPPLTTYIVQVLTPMK